MRILLQWILPWVLSWMVLDKGTLLWKNWLRTLTFCNLVALSLPMEHLRGVDTLERENTKGSKLQKISFMQRYGIRSWEVDEWKIFGVKEEDSEDCYHKLVDHQIICTVVNDSNIVFLDGVVLDALSRSQLERLKPHSLVLEARRVENSEKRTPKASLSRGIAQLHKLNHIVVLPQASIVDGAKRFLYLDEGSSCTDWKVQSRMSFALVKVHCRRPTTNDGAKESDVSLSK